MNSYYILTIYAILPNLTNMIKHLLILLSQDRDKTQSGKISYEQLEDIFRIYQVRAKHFPPHLIIETITQVELDEKAASKITDENGEIAKEDFIKISQDSKLLDFGNVMGGEGMKQSSTKKPSRSYNNSNVTHGLKGGKVFIVSFFVWIFKQVF